MTLLFAAVHKSQGVVMLADSRASTSDDVVSESASKVIYDESSQMAVGRWGSPSGLGNDRTDHTITDIVEDSLDNTTEETPGRYALALSNRLSEEIPDFLSSPTNDPFQIWENPLLCGGLLVAGYRSDQARLYRIVHGRARRHAGPPIVQPINDASVETARKTGQTFSCSRDEIRQWEGQVDELDHAGIGGQIQPESQDPGAWHRAFWVYGEEVIQEVGSRVESVNQRIQGVAFDYAGRQEPEPRG